MSAVSRKSFSDYFKILNKEAEKNPQNRAKAVVEINRVFESFGFWGTKRSKNLNLNGRIIPIEELTPKELIIFTVFAKKILQKVEIPEQQARILLKNVKTAEEIIENIFQHDKEKKLVDECLQNMLEAKRLVLLHEKLDQPPRVRAETIESEAKNYLNHLLRAEQSKALSLQNQIKEEKVIENLITWTARGVFTIGVALFLTTFPLLIFAGGIIGLPFMFLGALLSMGAGPYIGYLPDRQSLIIERKLEQILNEMEKLHTCKNIVTEPEFVAFAEDPKNRFQFFKNNERNFKKFIALYRIQKNYELRRHEAEARIQIIEEQMLVRNQDQQREGLKAIDLEVTSLTDERKQINSLRKELQLESLPI